MHKICRVYLYGRVCTLCVGSRELGGDVGAFPLEVLQRIGRSDFDEEGLSSYHTSAVGQGTDNIALTALW
jgi:hypothetical protein